MYTLRFELNKYTSKYGDSITLIRFIISKNGLSLEGDEEEMRHVMHASKKKAFKNFLLNISRV